MRRHGLFSNGNTETIILGVIVIVGICWFLSGCTFMIEDVAEGGSSHTSTMPAVQFCVLSACDGQWADRAERAGDDTMSDTGEVSATQEATAVPTVTIPITGMPSADMAEKVDSYLHSSSPGGVLSE